MHVKVGRSPGQHFNKCKYFLEDNMNLTNTYFQHLIKYATYFRRNVILVYAADQEILI